MRKKKLGKLNIKKELSKGQCDFCLDKYKEKILIKCYIITYKQIKYHLDYNVHEKWISVIYNSNNFFFF